MTDGDDRAEGTWRLTLALVLGALASTPAANAADILFQQTTAIRVPSPSGLGDPVTLLGVEAIAEGPCAGIVEKELPPWLMQNRVEVDPKVPADQGVYVVHRAGGKSVNERALETGCAVLKNVEGLAREQALRDAADRGAKAPTRMMTSGTTLAVPSPPQALSWSGAGRKSTETFQTSSPEWRVSWSLEPNDTEVGAVVSITVRRGDGSFVDTISSGQVRSGAADMSVVRSAPGPHYLEIGGVGGTWQVRILVR